MGKKIMACLMAVLLLCGSVGALAAAPETTSQSVCVMDADTGEILFEKDAQTQLPMASITKVMTALITLENGDLEATTTATAEALATVDLESTRVGFEVGEQLTIDELMYCMLVDSANDAANILAAAVGGTVENFVAMMNAKAEALGCTHTHFANPNGLDADGHYTCAHDMALITYAANQYPEFAKYSSQVSYTLPSDNVIESGWEIYTKVDMLDQSKETYDDRVYAAKTGWTTNAHNTFVACAKTKDESNFIVTLLNCPVKNGIFTETTALLDYAEAEYPVITVAADDYKKAAKAAAKQAGAKLDTDALQDFTIRLPKGMTQKDLAYTCEAAETDAQLHVTIAKDSQAAYQKETGLDGAQTLVSVPIELKQAVKEPEGSAAAAVTAEGSSGGGPIHALQHALDGLPELVRDVIMVVAVVVGAIVLMLVLLFLLGLYRQIKNRKNKKNRKHKRNHMR
ncbi:MAG: D-alanyl-D-alanine carboxypeptidase [Clostridia bacterium]|nr:D-alanyl-D-alanine carboxypeptidase [Clostridia bacterium]